CRPVRAERAAPSAWRSASVPDLDFGSPATIIRSDAPIAEASADADPPPGVGSDEANAASRSRTVFSVSNEPSLFDHRLDRLGPDAHQVDGGPGDDHRVHLF